MENAVSRQEGRMRGFVLLHNSLVYYILNITCVNMRQIWNLFV